MAFNKKAWMKEYRIKNNDHIKKIDKKWRLKNKDYLKEYKIKNNDHIRKQDKEYRSRPNVKEQVATYRRNRTRTDASFRLKQNLRSRLWHFLKGISKSARTMELVGCTIKELWDHLKSSPKWEPWMTRENYGRSGGWDIDHIKACAKFDQTDPAQQHECFHYSNLQPLEHMANIKKGAK